MFEFALMMDVLAAQVLPKDEFRAYVAKREADEREYFVLRPMRQSIEHRFDRCCHRQNRDIWRS